MPKTKDPEIAEFEAALLRSIDQAQAGDYVAVHTPADMAARKRGRPAQAITKVSTTIRFDADVLEALKATGAGWQTRANDALRAHLKIKPPKAAQATTRQRQTAKA